MNLSLEKLLPNSGVTNPLFIRFERRGPPGGFGVGVSPGRAAVAQLGRQHVEQESSD